MNIGSLADRGERGRRGRSVGAQLPTLLGYSGSPAPPAPPLPLLPADAVRLVLLDATWRKSRKMLYLNPALQRLPRLALTDVAPSNCRIRKAHAPHQLSSLEAAAQALGQLEGAPGRFSPLHDAFDGFVAQQAAYVRAFAAGSLTCNASQSDEQDVNRLVRH